MRGFQSSYLSIFLYRRLCLTFGIISLSKQALYLLGFSTQCLLSDWSIQYLGDGSFLKKDTLGDFSLDLKALSQICLSFISFAFGFGKGAKPYILLCPSNLFFFIFLQLTLFLQIFFTIITNQNSILNIMQQNYGSHSFFPNIIINADDYGYCLERSTGIIELIKAGCISSTSVIVNSPDSQRACDILNTYLQTQNPLASVSIGLHLNLTEFLPLTIDQKLLENPLIEKQSQLFKGKPFIYSNLNQLQANKSLVQFIYAETISQIQKFIKYFSFKPSHLDSHNHIHTIPLFVPPIAKACSMFGIYKTRIPIQVLASESAPQSIRSYNKKFIELSQESKKIYEKQGFIWPDLFVGLDSMGKDIKQVENRIRSICSVLKTLEIHRKTIEIMVHPGYSQNSPFTCFKTCQFSKSRQRQDQLQYLKSCPLREWCSMKSFNQLKKRKLQQSALIYSKLVKCTGNLTTSLRIKQILEELGFQVYLIDVPENNKFEWEENRVKQMVKNFGISFIIGVNLTRTSQIICKALSNFPIPYFLMIAGTDANITFNIGNDLELKQIYKGLQNSEVLISLSLHMKKTIQDHLQLKKIDKQILLIKQSTINQKYQVCIEKDQLADFSNIQIVKPYIVFPTSFRKVKDVGHVLLQLNFLIQKYCINVYIFGPIIDEDYYKLIEPALGRVKYMKCFPHNVYLAILKQATLLINCSESEGMSCSILEAFCEKVPVLVRQNSGNCQLVRDKVNGFLYNTGAQFVQKFEFLMKNYEELKSSLCQIAYQQVKLKYSINEQINLYKKALQDFYEPLIYQLNLKQIWRTQLDEKGIVPLFQLKGVHKISRINLKIFSKFFESSQGEKVPALYLDKIVQKSDKIKILDIGCGTGIFGIFFILQLVERIVKKYEGKVVKLNLCMADFDQQCIKNTKLNLQILERILSSSFNSSVLLENVSVVQSDMFSQLDGQRFDIILGNMPQTPFSKPETRLDKNGGQNGLKYTQILIREAPNHLRTQESFVLILYSYMQSSDQFYRILTKNTSKVAWRSSKQTHTIKKQQFEQMQKGLAGLIKSKIEKNESDATCDQTNFYVDAELRLLMYF